MQALSTHTGAGERIGLVGMRERITVLGGRREMESGPQAGTRVSIEVPMPHPVGAETLRTV
jgi:signal transduction histidine kinase